MATSNSSKGNSQAPKSNALSSAAKQLGTKGGEQTSPAKTSAVRANGALGGRPKSK